MWLHCAMSGACQRPVLSDASPHLGMERSAWSMEPTKKNASRKGKVKCWRVHFLVSHNPKNSSSEQTKQPVIPWTVPNCLKCWPYTWLLNYPAPCWPRRQWFLLLLFHLENGSNRDPKKSFRPTFTLPPDAEEKRGLPKMFSWLF